LVRGIGIAVQQMEQTPVRIEDIISNYQSVLERICLAARSVGRNPDEIKLVTVTKGQPLEKIRWAIQAGARLLGENYAEEGAEKRRTMGEHPGIQWHMIGHIQTRKARIVCESYEFVHSIDRLKLASRLDRMSQETGRKLSVLIQVNVSGEETKAGLPAWEAGEWPALLPEIDAILSHNFLEVCGLMTMAPYSPDPEASRGYYRHLRHLQAYLGRNFPNAHWDELSMGMSEDFEIAIQEGATYVRIGQAILGSRPILSKIPRRTV